jgi:hypothetical protein
LTAYQLYDNCEIILKLNQNVTNETALLLLLASKMMKQNATVTIEEPWKKILSRTIKLREP